MKWQMFEGTVEEILVKLNRDTEKMHSIKHLKRKINHYHSSISNIQFKTKKFNMFKADIILINSTDYSIQMIYIKFLT